VAEESERAGQWFAALWHLDRMIAARPVDGPLHARRAHAHVALGHWDMTIADASEAIAL
jgi:hypothetical protein